MGFAAEALQDGPEGRLDDRLGEGPRRVVRARPPALVGRLEHHGLGRNDAGRGGEGDLTLQGRDGVLGRGRLLRRSGGLARHGLVGLLLEPLGPVGGLGGEEFLQVDRRRCAVRLRGLDGDRAALGHFEVEAHHRLVNRADLLDVEGAVAEPLAVEDEQVLKHAKDDTVGDTRGLLVVSC